MYKQPAFNSSDSVNSFKNHNTHPLTHENLSKIQAVDPSETPLARYFSAAQGSQSTASLKKKRHQDYVLESPRIVAFPYHNDASFLPTAEHDYPGSGLAVDTASIASLSVHTVGSRSTLRHPSSPVSTGFRRCSFQRMPATTRDHGSIISKRTDSRSLYKKRRSGSFSTVLTHSEQSSRYDKDSNDDKKRLGRRLKQGFLRFKSTVTVNSRDDEPYSSSSSYVPSLVSGSTKTSLEDETEPCANRTWYKKLWKFIKPTEKSRTEANITMSPTDPVWYTQYRSNPSL